MGEVTIEVDKDGNCKAELRGFKPEDPACNVFQRIVNSLKGDGVTVTETKIDQRKHGHAHDFVHHHK